MSEKIIHAKARFKPRSDTAANWASANPVLLKGEPGVVLDGTETEWLKIGDGVTPFLQLPWKKGPQGEKGDKGDKGDPGEDAVTDEHYSPKSENAQSGKAVAEAVNPIMRYITYSIQNGKVTITGCDTSISGDYETPEKIEGYTVTEIGANAFINCASLKSIALPRYVGIIGNNAFKNCSTLETVTHSYIDGETQIIIGPDAFRNCSSLSDVYIVYEPDSDTITEIIGSGNGKYTAATFHYNQAPAKLDDVYNHHDSTKQDTLTAGQNITIENGTISADVKKWRKIVDVTITQETQARVFTFANDINGNSFSLSEARVLVIAPADDDITTSTKNGYICVSEGQSPFVLYGAVNMKSKTKTTYTLAEFVASNDIATYARMSVSYPNDDNKYSPANLSLSYGEVQTIHSEINRFRIYLNETDFKAGTRFVIWGLDK